MTIRLIARDLYRLEREVDRLENLLLATPLEKRAELRDQLRKAKAERNTMRRILEGAKESPSTRRPR